MQRTQCLLYIWSSVSPANKVQRYEAAHEVKASMHAVMGTTVYVAI